MKWKQRITLVLSPTRCDHRPARLSINLAASALPFVRFILPSIEFLRAATRTSSMLGL